MAAAASTAPEASALGGAHFRPAEVDLRGAYGGGLDSEAPAARPSWVRRMRATIEHSVWAPVAVKVLALAIGLVALAGVGIASILSGIGGVQVPVAGALGSDIHAAWLATQSTSGTGSHAGAVARAPDPSASASAVSTPSGAGTGGTDGAGTTTSAASAGMTEDGKVILNLATVADLRHLPGVGAKRADAILALRARLGRFKSVNDLMRVKGIGVRGLKKILPHVVLDAGKPSA